MRVRAADSVNGFILQNYITRTLYYGDLDGNGKVTVTDLSTLNQAVNGRVTLTEDEKIRADLDGDGKITKADIALMEQFIAEEITEFPVEYQLASIEITVQPLKMFYTVGESLNTAGMVVTVKYNNGTTRKTTGYKVIGSTNTPGKQKIQISYTEEGITKSTFFYIQVDQKQVQKKVLNYDANGGSNAPDMQSADVNSIIQVSTELPVKYYIVSLDANGGSGMVSNTIQVRAKFVGWNTKRDGTGVSYLPGASLRLDTDMQLYACYESEMIGIIPVPVRNGHTFLGWYNGAAKVSANTRISSDCRLIARWEENIHVHTPDVWVIVSEATATEYGKRVKKCVECGAVIQEQIIPKLQGAEGVGEDQEGQQNEQQGNKQKGDPVTTVPDIKDDDVQKPVINDGEVGENWGPDDTWPGDIDDMQDGIKQDDILANPGDQGIETDNTDGQYTDTSWADDPNLETEQTEKTDPDADWIDKPDLGLDDPIVGDKMDDDPIAGDQMDEGPSDEQNNSSQPVDYGEKDNCHVEWNVSSAKLQKGKSTTALKAYVIGKDEIVKYMSSDTSIAEVTDWGEIRGKKVGTVYITAMTEKGSAASVRIKVQKKTVMTKKLTVKKKKISMKAGKIFYLQAKVRPITSSQRIKFHSTNARVASVDRTGQIKAKKKGVALIKVKSGKKVVKVKITVK